jgi:hypothetical protein
MGVVLADSVDLSHAQNPTNDSERLVFRELFETLIHLDCQRVVRPGLAVAWSPDTSRRMWTFQLRKDEASPGLAPPAYAVASSWRDRRAVLEATGIESVTALDGERLTLTFKNPSDSVPRVLADPRLGVSYDRGSILNRNDRFLIVRPEHFPPAMEFRVEPGTDPRDAIDAGADLIVTRDPAITEYVSSRSEFRRLPLPWSRTYVLVQPGSSKGVDLVLDDSLQKSLAHDVVRADARPAQGPLWWESATSCRTRGFSGVARPTSSRVVYPAGDPVARDLAQRIVALLAPGTKLSSAPLGSADLARALLAGSERAFVLSLPIFPLAPCLELAGVAPDLRIQPLVDTRATAILRRGSPPLTADWDGTIRVEEREASP